MKKLIASFVAATAICIAAKAAPLIAFTFSATTTNINAVATDNARVRGRAAWFSVTNSVTNATYIKLSSHGTGTLFRASGPIVLFDAVITNQISVALTNLLYQDTVRMSVSNAGAMVTNAAYGVLLLEQ